MALADLLLLSKERDQKKRGISEDRIRAIMEPLRDAFSCWREYPDLLVDFYNESGGWPQDCLKLFFYQRIFLRAVMRHRHAYATFPRAFSKSFLSVLILFLRCILFPNSHLFVTTGGKQLFCFSY